MELQEALTIIASYGNGRRKTHEGVLAAFRAARTKKELLGSTARVTREEVRREHPSRSTGTVSAYMLPIEITEYAKDAANSKAAPPQSEGAPKPLPAVEKAFAAILAAVEAAPSAITEAYAARSAEQSANWQQLLHQQQTAADAERSEAAVRNADLEKDSHAAGKEAEDNSLQIDELQNALSLVKAERENAVAAEIATAAAHEITTARLAAAEAQITTYARTEQHFSEELSRLLTEREGLLKDADRARELRAEAERLRHRLDAEAAQHQVLTAEIRESHTREIAALTAQAEAQTRRAEFLESGVLGALTTAVEALDRQTAKS